MGDAPRSPSSASSPSARSSACEDTGAQPTTTVQATDSADQVLEGFSHYVTKDGIRRSRVEADTAFFYENTQVTQLQEGPGRLLRHQGRGELDPDRQDAAPIAGRTARWRPTARWWWSRPDGRRLETETLKYDNATNTISTDMHFTFDRGDGAPGGQQLPLRPGLQERRDRQAARRGGRRHAAAGAGPLAVSAVTPGPVRLASAGGGAGGDRLAAAEPGRRPGAAPKPPARRPPAAPAAPKPSPSAPSRPRPRRSAASSRSTTSTARAP